MTTGIQQTYDERAKLVTQMQEITTTAAKEGRAMTTDEVAKWEKIEADEALLSRTIDAHEKTEKLVAERAAVKFENGDAAGRQWTSTSTATQDTGSKRAYEQTYETFLRFGHGALSPEQRHLMSEHRGTNTQVVGTDGLGGYLVPDEWAAQIEKYMLDYSGILQAATIMRTSHGRTMNMPTVNDTTTKSVKTAEAAAATTQDLTFAQVQLDVFKYSSKMLVSSELVQDDAYNIEQQMTAAFADRFGRILNQECTLGDGTGDPNGVVTATSAGKTAASATAITLLEVLDLKHSIDPAYRRSTKFGFMFNDAILLALKKLVDSEGRPLWQPSYRENQPDTIDGTQYWINQDMDSSINASSKLMLCGDFSKYTVRIAKDMTVQRLNELYAANDLIGFHAWMRFGGNLLNTAAIKHLITAAS